MISPKQKKILAFPYSGYDALICDGAVRSGKTSIMMIAFVDWAMREFSGQRFGICGKTVDSATKNIIVPYISMSYAKERYTLRWRRSDKLLEVKRGAVTNWLEVFGGKDESSFMLIQGRTLAGVLLDEVALMPESFVNQALARCSVDGAKLWFSCNPSSPQHWFYTGWIKRHRERNALYLHFAMTDNPSLSKKTLEMYQSMYSGVFYQRYILGLWVAAEGRIYDCFDPARHVLSKLPELTGSCYVSCDYGTQNATVFLLWQRERGTERWVCTREYYYSGRDQKRQKTDSEFSADLGKWLDGAVPRAVVVDPSAASFIAELRKAGYSVKKADNDVLDGIRQVSTRLQSGELLFSSACVHTEEEFQTYVWDEKSCARGIDKPVKDNDHCMDAVRYFVSTILCRGTVKLKTFKGGI